MSSERHRLKAGQVLFDLVSTLEPRVRPLSQWFTDCLELTEKWFQSEGNQGVKRMKAILQYGWLHILGQKPETLPFVKSDNTGLPDLVKPLARFKGRTFDPRLYSALLTFVRLTDLWEGRPEDKDVAGTLDVIEGSRISGMAKGEIDKFAEFIPLFFKSYPNHPLTRSYLAALQLTADHEYLYRESKGPNGPLIESAHKDLASIVKVSCESGASLYSEVKRLQEIVCKNSQFPSGWGVSDDFLLTMEECFGPGLESVSSSEVPGKLSLKPEKGGKVRLVAQPDYFSQVALRPVHDWLMRILRNIPADCTYDQRKAIPRIVKWQKEGSFVASFDQSACTDRFPFLAQLQIIRSRFGSQAMEAMQTVMADRLWEISMPKGKTRRVRWTVGQPLGMFASWPLMALAHHLMVHYCYYMSHGRRFQRPKPFNRYVICGDDIVIADELTARYYQRTCKRFGMVINESKSHITGGSSGLPPVSEFAKIVVVRGSPLFPIRPKMVLRALEDKRNAIPLMVDLASSDTWSARFKYLEAWIRRVFPREKSYLTALLTIPREFGGLGFRDDRSIRRLVEASLPNIHPFVYWIGEKIRSALRKEAKELASCEALFQSLPEKVIRVHPQYKYLNELYQTKLKTRQLQDRIPSSYELVSLALVTGLGTLFDLLIDDPAVDPLWANDREHEFNRTLWDRVLRSKHPIRPAREDLSRPSLLTEVMNELSYRSHSDPSWLVEAQVSLIKSALLGVRSSQAKA